MPYVEYTGRTYNERIIAGAVRVRQGQQAHADCFSSACIVGYVQPSTGS